MAAAISYGVLIRKKNPWFILLLRHGELCGLRQEDITGDIVHIQRSINEQREETRGKNENANRWFVLPDLAKNILLEQAQMLKKPGIVSPWVFPDEHGRRTDPKHIYEMWRTYKTQHDIKSSPYVQCTP